MVEIEQVSLNVTWPDNELRVVMMQPHVSIDTKSEPFVWLEAERERQINKIQRTLEIAARNGDSGNSAHFTLLPEYSIPGLRGITVINDVVSGNRWPQNSVLIGGVDGLTKTEYEQLIVSDATYVSENNREVPNHQWINCGILWAKQADGSIARWVQPKMSPSWLEEAIIAKEMFPGRSVYVFTTRFENGTECRFIYVICFDWIASDGGSCLLWDILERVDALSNPTKRDVNLFFVLQHNPSPNHHTFLENTRHYFEDQAKFPFTLRNDGAVLFVNTAGGAKPGRYSTHGCSSMVFSPRAPYDCEACPPTAAVVTKKLRASDSLGRCKDSLLREGGECLHRLRLTLPQFLNLGSTERSLPIKSADVFALDGNGDDPRTPGQPVPAIVKWVNDQLDVLAIPLANEQTHALKELVENCYQELSASLRRKTDDALSNCIRVAGVKQAKSLSISGLRPVDLVDNWDDGEIARLKTVVQTLSVLRAFTELDVSCSPGHAVIKSASQVYDVIVVTGDSHQECFEHAMNTIQSSEQRIKIIITQDTGDTILPDRDKPITAVDEIDEGKGPNITDPYASCKHLGHQNIVSACHGSREVTEFNTRMSEMLRL